MALEALIARLQHDAATSATSAISVGVAAKPAPMLGCTPATPATPQKCNTRSLPAFAGVSWRWRLHFADREPMEVAFSPEATHGEVLDFYPDALAAEPIEAGGQEPGAIMAGDIPAKTDGDSLRTCNDCGNLRGAVCIVAKPGGLVSAIVGYRPGLPELPRRCAGYSPNADDPDQRPGHERWPGLARRGTRHADH